MKARYAVYYAPPAHSELWRRGCRWLGRDPQCGEALEQPSVPGFAATQAEALTASARMYGFHATLKPPFLLRSGRDERDIERALLALAQSRAAFALPPLQVARIGGFLALTPVHPSAALADLAQACVRQLDGLREPPDAHELQRRCAAGLSPHQKDLLTRWGYPYVLEEFRFHLTLTAQVDTREADALSPWLAAWFAPALEQPLTVEDVSLYVQPAPGAPFRLLRRFPFVG